MPCISAKRDFGKLTWSDALPAVDPAGGGVKTGVGSPSTGSLVLLPGPGFFRDAAAAFGVRVGSVAMMRQSGELGWFDLMKRLEVEQKIDIQHDDQVFVHFRQPGDVGSAVVGDRVGRGLDLVPVEFQHSGYAVDGAPHGLLADVDDDRSGFVVGIAVVDAEQRSEVNDWDDRATQVAYAVDIVGDLRDGRDGFQNDNFADLIDSKRVTLSRELKFDELHDLGAMGGTRRDAVGRTGPRRAGTIGC